MGVHDGLDEGSGVGRPALYVGLVVGESVGVELGLDVGSGVGLPAP